MMNLLVALHSPRQTIAPPLMHFALLFSQLGKNDLLAYIHTLIPSYTFYFIIHGMESSMKQVVAKIILIKKKIGRKHGVLVYKKALISEHRKNYIFRDINK